MSIGKIDSYLERTTESNKRSVLRAVKKYVLELDNYSFRMSGAGIHKFSKKYVVTDPNDVYFYERSGINLGKDIVTQIGEFKERIVKDAVNGKIEKDFIEDVCAYFCCDVVKIEELYSDIVNPKREEKEIELMEKVDGLLKTLRGLTWHPRNRDLDKSKPERLLGQISERLHKHGLNGIGRPFLIRLGVMKASSSKEPVKVGVYNELEPVTIEDMEIIVKRLEKETNHYKDLITEHSINCAENKMIKEVMREQTKKANLLEDSNEKVMFTVK